MTDGMPTVVETDINKILSNVNTRNAGKVRIFVFGVGNDVNTDLLDRLAEENHGTRDYVREHEDIEIKVGGFFKKYASVGENVVIIFEGKVYSIRAK